jgi:hypothetical protein
MDLTQIFMTDLSILHLLEEIEGQSRIDNPETLTTLGTIHRAKINKTKTSTIKN